MFSAVKLLQVVVLAAALTSCAGRPSPPVVLSVDDVMAKVALSWDDFKKVTSYRGPNVPAGPFDGLFLRAWKKSGESTLYQIYVADYYPGDWRFYSEAYDSEGKRLDVVLISRKVGSCGRGGCSHFEHIGINVSREYLESAVGSGLTFKVSGRAGDEVFRIPGFHISGFLEVVPK